jgi:4Fe-4S ferredoxin
MSEAEQQCKEPGVLLPVIDRNRCEAKGDCVRVCPYNVFELASLSEAQRAELSMLGKLKAFFHGGRQAFVTKPADCHACGQCVIACPEHAIKLQRVVST